MSSISDNGVSGNSGAAFITHVIASFSKNIGIATPAPHKYKDGRTSEIPAKRTFGGSLQNNGYKKIALNVRRNQKHSQK